jgi:hypothetical protein
MKDYQTIKNQQLYSESRLQHVCAQARHISSGLQSIKKFVECSKSAMVSGVDETEETLQVEVLLMLHI